jgi:2-amino-4-hydroxy-6-hydroxymethyldihydropteridine diphosphokinase
VQSVFPARSGWKLKDLEAQIENKVIITLGSNIDPEVNLASSIELLREEFILLKTSSVIETLADGAAGPNFLNAAATFCTSLSNDDLKMDHLRRIEALLGRIRSEDKNSPRTIDLDIAIRGLFVYDSNIWDCIYMAVPIAELIPDLINPKNGKTISETALELKGHTFWKMRPEIKLVV